MHATANLSSEQSVLVLRWVKRPQQARTRQTLSRILDAAEHMVATNGFDDTSIADIARSAGSSVGGFYRRFRDKDGLLQALHERFCEEARATADEAFEPARWAGASSYEILAAFAGFLVEIYRERAGLFRAFLHRAIVDRSILERQEELFEYLADGLTTLLDERLDEIRHPEPAVAVRFALRVLLGTLDEVIALRAQPPNLEDGRITAELTRLVTAYLSVPSPIDPKMP